MYWVFQHPGYESYSGEEWKNNLVKGGLLYFIQAIYHPHCEETYKKFYMNIKIKHSRKSLVLFAIVICVFFLVKCTENGKSVTVESAQINFEEFAGKTQRAGRIR